jgi:hypothetical protein
VNENRTKTYSSLHVLITLAPHAMWKACAMMQEAGPLGRRCSTPGRTYLRGPAPSPPSSADHCSPPRRTPNPPPISKTSCYCSTHSSYKTSILVRQPKQTIHSAAIMGRQFFVGGNFKMYVCFVEKHHPLSRSARHVTVEEYLKLDSSLLVWS